MFDAPYLTIIDPYAVINAQLREKTLTTLERLQLREELRREPGLRIDEIHSSATESGI